MDAPSHTSRFKPQRNIRRYVLIAFLVLCWVSIRLTQDASSRAANPERKADQRTEALKEVQYRVVAVDTPFQLTLAEIDKAGANHSESGPVAVRLLGISRPWQWNRDPDNWATDTMEAIKTWIGDDPITVQLSRRQISDDGVLLTHLSRDDELLSDFLVRQGWVAVDPDIDPSDGSIRRLYRAEDEARLAARGIWSGRALGMIDHPGL